jgi:hypothetical protein
MNRIRSAIGETNFQPSGNRRFVVGDGSEQPVQEISPSVVAGMRQQVQDQQAQAEHKNLTDARRRIEIITGLGRKTRDVLIDTNGEKMVFTLRTLKTFEYNSLAQVIEGTERITLDNGRMIFSPSGFYKIKVEALSHSLFMVDGQSIDIVLGTVNMPYEEKVEYRKDLVLEMDSALIDHLFTNYELLAQEVQDGYLPKTPQEAEEVVETIHKSGEDA